MHAFTFPATETLPAVERITKAEARKRFNRDEPITNTDSVTPSRFNGRPAPFDTAENTGQSFTDYSNSADYFATGTVYYWGWTK